MGPCKAVCFDLFNTLVSVGEVPDSVGRYTADVLGVDRELWNSACFGPAHEICRPSVHEDILRTLAHSIDPTIPLDRISEATKERQARFEHRDGGFDLVRGLFEDILLLPAERPVGMLQIDDRVFEFVHFRRTAADR